MTLTKFLECSRFLRSEGQSQEIVIEGHKLATRSWISLPRTAADELAIDAARLVQFGADDMQAADFADARAEFDVRSAARHVRRHRDAPSFTSASHDLSFGIVMARVQDLMRNSGGREQTRQVF